MQDFKTAGSAAKAQAGPYTSYLKADALKGKRFGVPGFIFQSQRTPLQPETKAMLLLTIELIRKAGAEVVIADDLLPLSFLDAEKKVDTGPYRRDGAMQWLGSFGPAEYQDAAQYKAATGHSLPPVFTGVSGSLDDLVDAASGPSCGATPQARRAGRTAIATSRCRWY